MKEAWPGRVNYKIGWVGGWVGKVREAKHELGAQVLQQVFRRLDAPKLHVCG